jgi:hypothetical protein
VQKILSVVKNVGGALATLAPPRTQSTSWINMILSFMKIVQTVL